MCNAIKKHVKLRIHMSIIVVIFDFNKLNNSNLKFQMKTAMKSLSVVEKTGIILLISAIIIYLILSLKFLLS